MLFFWTILFLLFGFYLLIKSADIFVDGAAGLAKKYNVPKLIVGLTLVAFGTSAPEATVSLIAALQGSADIAIGNVIGSNLANIALVLGVAALIRNIPASKSTISHGIPLSILAMVVLIVVGYDSFFQNHDVAFNRISFGDGLILLFFFIVFLYYIFGDFKSTQQQEEEIEKKEMQHYRDAIWFLALMIVGGMAGIMVGGKLVVDQAVVIATALGISEAIVGLTIVALGTSLPELVTSVVAAFKNEKDIAIGNIVGSNVFNVFLVLGVTAVVIPVNFDPSLMFDAVYTLAVTVIFFLILVIRKQLTRFSGAVLLGFYIFYILSLVFRESFVGYIPF